MEKRSRSDTTDTYADGDDESQADSTDNNKLGVPQHNQSHASIISMEDEEFASDDEKVKYNFIVILCEIMGIIAIQLVFAIKGRVLA